MNGVWKISLKSIEEIIKSAPLHQYRNRIYDDKGNSKESYVLDLQNPLFEKLI